MNPADRDPTITLCIFAALADGARSQQEQEQFTRITGRLDGAGVNELVARVQHGDVSLSETAARLSSPEAKRTAYEMAVAMVYADGDANERERAFLAELLGVLALDPDGIADLHAEASRLANAPLGGATPSGAADAPLPERKSQAGIPAVSHEDAVDAMIRRQAMLAGALELLPQQLASLAIIPIQMRLVYRIGADYGHKLDAAQIKDLLGTMGIGALGQMLDGVTRRVLGGLGRGVFGSVLGVVVGGAAGLVAGAGVAFVTTYALGHAAKQYYAQGRTLSAQDVRALFQRFSEEAAGLLPQLQHEIHAQSRHIDLGRLLGTIRGGEK